MTGRKHIELQPVDMTEGWQTPPGFPSGMVAKVLSGNLDEVYVVSGDLQRYPPNTYTCRPPGVWRGPFKSETGCLLLEIHYFDPAEAR